VGDEDVREPELRLQFAHRVQHLRLDGDVQRRDRLVTHDEVGLDRQRAGEVDPLALPAGEGVRVAVVVLWVQPHCLQEAAGAGLPPLGVEHPAGAHRFLDDRTDLHPRVQRRLGVLEDELCVLTDRPECARAQFSQVSPFEVDGPVGRLDQPEDRSGERALPTARLADQPEGLAPVDVERDVVDRLHPIALHRERQPAVAVEVDLESSKGASGLREVLGQPVDPEERLAGIGIGREVRVAVGATVPEQAVQPTHRAPPSPGRTARGSRSAGSTRSRPPGTRLRV